ncbi:MAG: dihydroorotase [Leptospirillia bacterium]
MTTTTLIQNGALVLPDGRRETDLVLSDGRIERICDPGERLQAGAFDRVIDAAGLTVLPGAIDVHVHFRTPGGEHKEDWDSGSRAALAGGVTTVLDMPNTDPPTVSREILDDKRVRVGRLARVNWGLFMGATADNLEEVLGAENIAGLKVYMGSSTGGLLVYEEGPLARIFQKFPGMLCVHAEDEAIIRANSLKYADATTPDVHPKIRSHLSARRATERAIGLARRFSRPLHICHMSTAEELELVSAAADADVTCEVAPHHLMLTADAMLEMGTLAKMNPPLRTAADTAALWRGLSDGRIACVATDHAPHTLAEKAESYWAAPSGVPGVQHMVPILLNAVNRGTLTIERMVEITAGGPARLFGIGGKGQIAEGYDADLTLVDLNETRKVVNADVVSKCGWTPYEGMTFTGWPVTTLLGGEVAYERGAFAEGIKGREVRFAG